MIFKAVTVLAIAATCYAIPIEEALKAEGAPKPEIIAKPMEEKPLKTELVAVPEKTSLEQPGMIAVPVPTDAKVPGAKPENDLKTDNTLWWNNYYRYPVHSKYYYNYHYVPRTYTYYESFPSTYTHWRSYW